METITEKINRWPDLKDEFIFLKQQIEYLAEKRFAEYQPAIAEYPDFLNRLVRWLNNVKSDFEQQILFKLILKIFFVGSKEFNSLYRAAFNGPIARWIVEDLGEDLTTIVKRPVLSEEVRHTWFCPITDSMQISAFYHVNHISGHDHRPYWRDLFEFGNEDKIKRYVKKNNIKRLVLLEDFVGSGSQAKETVEFAAEVLPAPFKIIFVPLIICPEGLNCVQNIASSYSNLSIEPVLLLDEGLFIREIPSANEDEFTDSLRQLIVNNHDLVTGGTAGGNLKVYSPYGYNRTGGLIVMYTNCPDNTLPMIHYHSDSWYPIFPRSSRV
ncbi:hypothetical protein HNR65_002414 [Desulfosalsimonas propionicica]|uniref:PRTase-CE domain-containing protein n=1 Tax=Desulfosalsimonas propionicica TaxID=332175 RepID=A0A7W0HLA4_9BACT|nr:hypothetical protein [Desulfosalsimonas propionicica]MBA2882080.1 hypothetical protein [Desulfosalsimonas propionicica]